MELWLSPKKAAIHIKKQNPNTMITENGIRTLIKKGFPCVKFGTRSLVNVNTFDLDLHKFNIK